MNKSLTKEKGRLHVVFRGSDCKRHQVKIIEAQTLIVRGVKVLRGFQVVRKVKVRRSFAYSEIIELESC